MSCMISLRRQHFKKGGLGQPGSINRITLELAAPCSVNQLDRGSRWAVDADRAPQTSIVDCNSSIFRAICSHREACFLLVRDLPVNPNPLWPTPPGATVWSLRASGFFWSGVLAGYLRTGRTSTPDSMRRSLKARSARTTASIARVGARGNTRGSSGQFGLGGRPTSFPVPSPCCRMLWPGGRRPCDSRARASLQRSAG